MDSLNRCYRSAAAMPMISIFYPKPCSTTLFWLFHQHMKIFETRQSIEQLGQHPFAACYVWFREEGSWFWGRGYSVRDFPWYFKLRFSKFNPLPLQHWLKYPHKPIANFSLFQCWPFWWRSYLRSILTSCAARWLRWFDCSRYALIFT